MTVSALMYPSIHAKLEGMYAQKIKKEELEELMKQNTTKQAVALLKSFHSDFKNLEDNPRRSNIKMVLDNILIADMQKIYRLLNRKDRQVWRQFISIYEIKCIKSVFRKLVSGSSTKERTTEMENWTNQLFKNLIGIWKVEDDSEFLEFVCQTKYGEVFKKYGENLHQINIFEVENQLDKMYFEQMMKTAKVYNQALEDMIGKQIDLNNIIWIKRVKENYHFSKEETKHIVIPVQYKLKKTEIENLIQADSEEELSLLKHTYYAKYINFDRRDDLEEQIDLYLYQTYKKYFKSDIFEIGAIYAYINILEKENNDIMNVIEGIRYNLKKEEIRQKIIR